MPIMRLTTKGLFFLLVLSSTASAAPPCEVLFSKVAEENNKLLRDGINIYQRKTMRAFDEPIAITLEAIQTGLPNVKEEKIQDRYKKTFVFKNEAVGDPANRPVRAAMGNAYVSIYKENGVVSGPTFTKDLMAQGTALIASRALAAPAAREQIVAISPDPTTMNATYKQWGFESATYPSSVGDYGVELHKGLSTTASVVLEALNPAGLNPKLASFEDGFVDVDFYRKFQPNGTMDKLPSGSKRLHSSMDTKASTALLTMTDTVRTYNEVLTLLTQNKVGNLSGPELVRKILSPAADGGPGLIVTLAARMPTVLLPTWSRTGRYFPDPLQLSAKGELVFNPKFLEFLKAEQKKEFDLQTDARGIDTGRGCPFVRPMGNGKNAIQEFASLYLQAYEKVQASVPK
jgi:hypothetical protein